MHLCQTSECHQATLNAKRSEEGELLNQHARTNAYLRRRSSLVSRIFALMGPSQIGTNLKNSNCMLESFSASGFVELLLLQATHSTRQATSLKIASVFAVALMPWKALVNLQIPLAHALTGGRLYPSASSMLDFVVATWALTSSSLPVCQRMDLPETNKAKSCSS